MMIKKEFPILEFDDNKEAFINPRIVRKILDNNKPFPSMLIICFFKEVINNLIEEGQLKLFAILKGENDSEYYKFVDDDILVIHGKIGSPSCGGILEEAIALGVDRVMFCGGAGSLVKEVTCGKYIIVSSAIRDEGTSYHYIEPSREIEVKKVIVDKIRKYLDDCNLDYIIGKTWTTDAFYRETIDKINLRREEGAIIVEMEQSALIAISQFRDINYGAIIYGGDDLTKEKWDNRDWCSRKDVRQDLLFICKNLVQKL